MLNLIKYFRFEAMSIKNKKRIILGSIGYTASMVRYVRKHFIIFFMCLEYSISKSSRIENSVCLKDNNLCL
jgi:hypothetical protein